MKKVVKMADEVNSFEYLSEHLYQRALKGGFEAEFNQLKSLLPYLNQFERLIDLIELVQTGDEKLVNYLLTDLVRLYRTRKDLRPAIVVIVIIILWPDLTNIYEELPERPGYDERFADIYWHLFQRMKWLALERDVNIRAEIIRDLRTKFVA